MRTYTFRRHRNGEQFLAEILPIYDGIALCTMHSFAAFDQYPELPQKTEISKSFFVNERTLALLEFMKMKYEQQEFDLSDGYPIIVEYLKNFGFRWEDTEDGNVWYQVVDI